MNEKNICPRCGNPVSPHAPHGVCPACLAKANLGTGATSWGGGASGSSAAMPVPEVARLFPEMEVLELIGAGGMGAVYKARQPKLDRLVALKILHRDERDAGFVERFSREARTLARLNHPNIVAVHEFGEREGLFFLIMELVDGATLRQLLGEGKMKPEQALAIVPPICEALQYAHEKGVVHRDIKPENILVDKEGRVKVADFGIARLAGAEATGNLTGEGQVVGTALYMAPEQVERPASVDHRADIYALGVVFYEMLTGELPLGRFPEPSKRVQVDVRLDEVVLKALEKEPGRRYQTAVEMRTRVETVSGPRAAVAGTEAKSAGGNEAIRRRVLLPAIGLLVVAVLNALPGIIALLFHSLSGSGGMLVLGPVLVWGFALFVIVFGAIQMMRLQSYGWAIAGTIVAMFLPPGFLIGIPVGIWALVVLSQQEVRGAFPGGDQRAVSGSKSSGATREVWIAAAGIAVVLLGMLLLLSNFGAIAIPAWERAWEERNVAVDDGSASGSMPDEQAASAVPAPVAPEATEVGWWDEPEVSVTQYGPDHLSFRGSAEEVMDACRTVLRELGYKELLGENSVHYPYYQESGSSDSSDGEGVAERVFLETKDGDGAVYRVTFVYLQGKDPVVMLEDTSEDRHRLVHALHQEFARREFKVVWAGEDLQTSAARKSASLLVEFEGDSPALVTFEVRPSRGNNSFTFNPVRTPAGIPFTADLRDAPDGDYLLWVRAPGYAAQWHGVTVENGIYRFSHLVSGEEEAVTIRLWKLRYLLLSYYVVHADEPNFDRPDVEFHRVAASHGGRLPVLQGDFIVWQGEETGGRFGPDPFLQRHRWMGPEGGPWGSISIGRREQFETIGRFEKEELSSRWRNTHLPGMADRAYLMRIHGNDPREDCFVKLWVEGIYDEPPEGVRIYRDPKQQL